MKDVIYGLIGGVIGAAVWAGVVYFTEYEIGWIAWGIGGLVGYAVAMGNQDRSRSATAAGTLAVVITALSIVGGKYAAIELIMPSDEELIAMFSESFESEEYVMSFLADDVAAQYEAEGRPVEWPEGVDPFNAGAEADYPEDVWAEASLRWFAMSEDERVAFREAREEESRMSIEANLPEIRAMIGRGGFLASFTPMDLIFFGLGMVTAFGVGSGKKSEEEVAAALKGAVLMAMVRVMAADGEVEDDEVATVKSIFNELTGAELDEEALRAQAQAAGSGSKNLVAALEDLAPHLSAAQRETVIRSAIMVAMADGAVDDSEQALISELAEAVDVSESHMRGILAQISGQGSATA